MVIYRINNLCFPRYEVHDLHDFISGNNEHFENTNPHLCGKVFVRNIFSEKRIPNSESKGRQKPIQSTWLLEMKNKNTQTGTR